MTDDDDDNWCFTATFVHKGNEAKSEMKHPTDMLMGEIQTWVVVICDPMRYQLDRGGRPTNSNKQLYYNYSVT